MISLWVYSGTIRLGLGSALAVSGRLARLALAAALVRRRSLGLAARLGVGEQRLLHRPAFLHVGIAEHFFGLRQQLRRHIQRLHLAGTTLARRTRGRRRGMALGLRLLLGLCRRLATTTTRLAALGIAFTGRSLAPVTAWSLAPDRRRQLLAGQFEVDLALIKVDAHDRHFNAVTQAESATGPLTRKAVMNRIEMVVVARQPVTCTSPSI